MKAERLLELYDRISEAPDAVSRLRRFVLDLAVRGKLVEQDLEDAPASELLERSAKEKSRLIKEGQIRKPRDLGNEVEEPFALPDSWCWCRLDSVGAIVGGGTPSASDAENFAEPGEGISWLTPADLGRYSGEYISRGTRDLSEKGLQGSSATLMPKDSVLFTSRAPIGYVAIASNPVATNQGFKSVVPFLSESSRFIALVLKTFAPDVDRKAPGTTFKEVSGKIVAGIAFPLPPLAEQHRIVAKVDELLTLCDRLEEQHGTREATRNRLTTATLSRLTAPDTDEQSFRNHARFALDILPTLTTRPDQIKALRQTILDLAVRGKLVEQEPEDESATELFKRLSKAKEEAFAAEDLRKRQPVSKSAQELGSVDAPGSWVQAKFDDVLVIVSGVTKGQKLSDHESIEANYMRVANVQRGFLDLSVVKKIKVRTTDVVRYRLECGDVLMTEGGDWDKLGRAAVWRGQISDCIHQNHVFRLRPPSPELLPEWVVLFANSAVGRSFFAEASKRTTNLASINMTQLRSCPLPLPPTSEQRRIVAKVDELMALCDRLEANLQQADHKRARLLESLLAEALTPAEAALEAA